MTKSKFKDRGIAPALILTIICFVAALALAATNAITTKPRADVAAANLLASQKTLFPDAIRFEAVAFDDKALVKTAKDASFMAANKAIDNSNKILGFLIQTKAKGYGGDVPIMVAITTDGSINGVSILPNQETPGLGQKISDSTFVSQFKTKQIRKVFTARKVSIPDSITVDAVSGATISSDAVARATTVAGDAAKTLLGGK